ncbi:hypothetical protein C8Q75DRAFT_747796 [Abortiporus biennis]|nr:hypothetical protein C8Q75DRAFT_747796 [Abortiporus biennis]
MRCGHFFSLFIVFGSWIIPPFFLFCLHCRVDLLSQLFINSGGYISRSIVAFPHLVFTSFHCFFCYAHHFIGTAYLHTHSQCSYIP